MRSDTVTEIRIRPSGAALGADVEGADLANLDERGFAAIRAGLRDHLVLRFRGSQIDDRSFIELARRFGEVEPPEAHTRTAEMTVPGYPEMSIISNLIEDGVAKGEAGDGELRWHTDHGFMERPVALSMLLARALPTSGGDTSFANMYAAYERLPEDLKRRDRGPQGQASGQPFLDRQAAARLSGHRHRRSARAAGGAPSDRAHPSRERPQGALSRPPLRRLHPALAARGERGAAGRALGRTPPARS